MKYLVFLVFVCSIHICFGQIQYKTSVGLNVEYSYSGNTNIIVAGPALIWEPSDKNKYSQALDVNLGLNWNKSHKAKLVSSVSFYKGKLPGLMFGISSQQYYNSLTKSDAYKTDIRVSGEVIFAFFGFAGYRYQHPLKNENEALHFSRHSVFIKFPLPLKKIN